ncbi:MAG TPA: amino acid adenylation domain-containing protein, partial [Longimicrobium sp.]|nr:amino acid adenylation domain-containing protein [Longimicrobium sp.]
MGTMDLAPGTVEAFVAPLSFAQERLWVLDRMDPGGAGWAVPICMRLRGPLRVDALRGAWEALVDRHESLRTVFRWLDGAPMQVVLPSLAIPFPVDDLSQLPPGEREREARARIGAEVATPFDLAAGPLLRLRLFRLGADDHVLLANLHHIVTDGWSTGVLLRELSALYGAFARGEPSPLDEPELQYAEFAEWQRERLSGAVLERHLAHWRTALAGAPALLELPTDRPRPPVWEGRGALEPFRLPPSLGGDVQALAVEEGSTPFMVLLAAFAALLGRYAGADEVVVGTPIANRTRPEMEGVVGFFVNTLALRTDLSGDPPFRALLARVRDATLAAYAHQDLPFERLVDELKVPRSTAHAPVFQALFILQNTRGGASLPGLAVEPFDVEWRNARYDLTLALRERADGIEGALEYASALFDAETAARMAGHFRTLLEAACADPERRLSALPLLSAAERERVVSAWSGTDAPYAALPVHALVSAQSHRTPHAAAVIGAGDALTYGGLETRSNRLAHHLLRLGVARGNRVAISMERSPALLVAILAVWKAGAAYVPVDPAYPEERRAYMLGDCGAVAVLTDTASVDGLPASAAPVVVVDRLDLAEENDAPAVEVEADDLAYVIYTSGSTGRPKGVMVPHRGVANFLASMAVEPGMTPEDVLVAVTSLSFDIAVLELLLPLTAGASVVLATRDEAMEPRRLADLLDTSGATVMQATPATWRMLIQSGWEGKPDLALLCGGEALPPGLARQLLPRGRTLWNLYGPTETTIWSAAQHVESPESIHLGGPIANTRLYVLDPALQPSPIGVPGELFIGGDGVVRGYLDRAALTAERFVPDPFASHPGARLYRTGDRVRRKADGALEFLGRIDFQVKVRGFRVELGEIEAALAEHPAVRQAIAVVREEAGDSRIVAYLVPEGDAPAPEQLKEALSRRLPDYMLPAAYVALEAFPLTPNGKVDRRALPAPAWSAAAAGYAAPRDATEETLAALFREVLDVERVGVHDDFFDLGGHSLRGTQLVTRIRGVFGAEVPLRALFETPTIAGLARRVDEARGVETAAGADPVLPVPRDGRPLPLSFAQLRLWFLEQLEPGNARYNMAASLGLSGALDADVLQRALQAIVDRHESLRTTYHSDAGQPAQVIHPRVAFPLPLVDLSHLPTEEREPELARLGADEVDRPIDLATGPLLRGHLYRLEDGEHVLLLVIHHVVTDGWSMGVMLRELRALYAAFLEDRPSPLAPLPVQYADYAAWQHGFLQGETLARQLGYWKEKLAGAPTVLEIPADRPRPAVQRYRGSHRSQLLEPELSRALEALARREGATLYMVLLAAFYTLLHRYTGQSDLLVGAPVANRMRPEVEELVGFFVNTLVLRTDLSGDPTFRELVARVRETALGAYANQDVPFERLVEELGVPRALSHEPLFQVMFVLQNAAMGDVDLPGVSVRQRPMERRTTKFDFTVFLWADGGGIRGWWEYNLDLWDAETVDRLLGHYHTLLRALAADPDRPIGTLPLLTAPERRQVLEEWNDTAA